MVDRLITVRPACADDWPAVERLLLEHGLPLEGARHHFENFFVAHRSGELAGCAGLEQYGSVGLLRSVAVASDARDRGVGTTLSRAVLSRARQRGLSRLYLLTTTANGYFVRHGFVEVLRETAPPGLLESAEFRGACPASAVLMTLAPLNDQQA